MIEAVPTSQASPGPLDPLVEIHAGIQRGVGSDQLRAPANFPGCGRSLLQSLKGCLGA